MTPVSPSGAALPAAKPELKAAAKAFEAVFLRQMIASMRSASLGDDLLGSDAGKQFRDLADARTADAMAGRFGIAELIETQLKDRVA